jgi:putative transposase
MPWKECHVEDERLRFVARRLDGESMTALCAEFGISRKTGLAQYNADRPHQALDMKVPADLYQPSERRYRGLSELDYPLHDWAATVTTCGRICFRNRKINLSQVFAGQQVGVRQVDEHIWLVTFMHYDLGYFDDETCRLEPIENPFGPTVLPMSPE